MTRLKWLLIGLLIALPVAGGSAAAFSWGSGRIVAEKRSVPAFQGIDLMGSATVYLKQGPKQTLEVRTDDNLMRLLETSVINDTLRIGFRQSVARYSKCEIRITAPQIKYINVSGSGVIQGQNKLHAPAVSINISGSGALVLDLEARQVSIRIAGSGNGEIAGKAAELTAQISGSGGLSAFAFPVPRADVAISGSGTGKINVTEILTARISGSGTVEYRGNPLVNAFTSGSGRIAAAD